MARYDRIALLDSPSRSAAFPGWLVLRDLEERERDPDLNRRARARFLVLRPARRLLDAGMMAVDAGSLRQQLAQARAEVGRLPDRDPEREVLSHYLDQIEARSAAELVAAGLAVGGACEASGHGYAAEEFYRTAAELARANDLCDERIAADRSLAALCGGRAGKAGEEAMVAMGADTELVPGDVRSIAQRLAALSRERVPSG
jgi:hypothetical protein